MTLMNRLFGDWARQPFAAREWRVAGLDQVPFAELIECFAEELYEARTRRGTLILYNPGGLTARSRITAIALGSSVDEAAARLEREIPARLKDFADRRLAA